MVKAARTRKRIIASAIAVPLAVAVIGAFGPSAADKLLKGPEPDATPVRAGPTYPLPTCPGPGEPLEGADKVAFTNLHDRDDVDYAVTAAEGNATVATGHSLWLLAWASVAQRMFVLAGPMVNDRGVWRSGGLYLGEGNTNDEGKPFCLTAIIVDDGGAKIFSDAVASRVGLAANELPSRGTSATVVVRLRRGTPPSAGQSVGP